MKGATVVLSIFLCTTIAPNAYPQGVCKPKQIVVYTATWCGICTAARNFFHLHKVRFQEIDTGRSASKESQQIAYDHGVPYILAGGQEVTHYSDVLRAACIPVTDDD